MSYKQAMKHWKKPKVQRLQIIMDAGTGRWPAPWCHKCNEHITKCTCPSKGEKVSA